MAAPTVPYKVMPKGYQVTGDVKNGYKATVSYFMAWANAFTFADQIFGSTGASRVGPVTWVYPYRFPVANANLYAQSFTIDPCGATGNAIPFLGLKPGEFFSHAIVKVVFETPSATQQQSQDDPQNLQQLDPANPITLCEQSIKGSGKMETRKAGSYLFTGGSQPVKGDVGVLVPECKLSLTFPRVPYLPWKLIRPYIGSVNSVGLLDAAKGELLLEEMDTKIIASSTGMSQQVQLNFAWNSLGDWNQLPKSDGTLALVYKKGASDTDANRIYTYKDHRKIFESLQFNG
jgi:hypothetical protein